MIKLHTSDSSIFLRAYCLCHFLHRAKDEAAAAHAAMGVLGAPGKDDGRARAGGGGRGALGSAPGVDGGEGEVAGGMGEDSHKVLNPSRKFFTRYSILVETHTYTYTVVGSSCIGIIGSRAHDGRARLEFMKRDAND